MADAINEYGDLNREQAGYLKRDLLEVAMPMLVTQRFGQSHPIPKNETKIAKFRRYLALTDPDAPLVEAVPPDGQLQPFEDLTVVLQQWGDLAYYSDVIQDTHQDNIEGVLVKRIGQSMARTLEKQNIAVLKAGTNVQYASTAAAPTTRAEVNETISRKVLRKVHRTLRGADVEYFTDIEGGDPDYGTSRVWPSFWALSHTDMDSDVMDLPSFKAPADYASPGIAVPGEIGSCENFRFVTTTLFTPFLAGGAAIGATGLISAAGVNVDVYPVICLAPDAYGITPLKGAEAIHPIIMKPNVPSHSNPLAQKGSVGWKAWHGILWLQDDNAVRIECGATLNPD